MNSTGGNFLNIASSNNCDENHSDSNLLLVCVVHNCKLNIFGFGTAVCVPALVLFKSELLVV